MPGKEGRAPAENRHGGAPRDAASRVMGRKAPRKRLKRAALSRACAGAAAPERLSALRSRHAGAERSWHDPGESAAAGTVAAVRNLETAECVRCSGWRN